MLQQPKIVGALHLSGWQLFDAVFTPNLVSFARCFTPLLSIPNLVIDHQRIAQEIQALFKIYPPIHWRSQPAGALYGLSLSYNSQAHKNTWHLASFGHPRYQRYSADTYFKAPESECRTVCYGDYLDSLSFRRLLPEVTSLPTLNTLFKTFAMPIVRCTVRIIDGTQVSASLHDQGGMHQDDPPWEVLRVNICITGSEDFGLQYAGHKPIIVQAGNNLIINTDHDHRVWIRQRNPLQRIHLIIGLVPWLDYDAGTDTWTLNQHFGVHPYDIICQGLCVSKVEDYI